MWSRSRATTTAPPSTSHGPRSRHGADPVWRHIGVYAYRGTALERFVSAPPAALERAEKLEQLRALSLGLRIAAVEVDVVTQAVDRPDDVAVVERALAGSDRGTTARASSSSSSTSTACSPTAASRTSATRSSSSSFDVKDGYGIVALLAAGIEVALLTGRDSPAMRRRAAELGHRARARRGRRQGRELGALPRSSASRSRPSATSATTIPTSRRWPWPGPRPRRPTRARGAGPGHDRADAAGRPRRRARARRPALGSGAEYLSGGLNACTVQLGGASASERARLRASVRGAGT